MGYIGGRIPGHTGTQQKHKKVFASIKQWVKGRSFDAQTRDGDRRVVGKYELQPRKDRIADIMFLFLAILLLGAAGWWSQGINDKYSLDPDAKEIQHDGFTKDQKQAYQFLVSSGTLYLRAQDHRLAASEFNQALKIARYGKEARLGLLKAMDGLCLESVPYCDKAEAQRAFVKEMGWLEEVESGV